MYKLEGYNTRGSTCQSRGTKVIKNGKVIKRFDTYTEAQAYVQSCIENDAWNAANRD